MLPLFCPSNHSWFRNILSLLYPVRAILKYWKLQEHLEELMPCICTIGWKDDNFKLPSLLFLVGLELVRILCYYIQPPQRIKNYQTRGQTVSGAYFFSASLHDVCKSATWTSQCTFDLFISSIWLIVSTVRVYNIWV